MCIRDRFQLCDTFLLLRQRFFTSLKQAVEVGCAQCAVVQAVTRLAGLAPDHAAVVRTDVAVKTGLDKRLDDLIHIEAAAAGQVRALLERAVLHDLDVAHVHEADAVHRRILAHHLRDVVELRAAQRLSLIHI